MCQTDQPVRRHRAAYLAPSASNQQFGGDNADDQVIPLLVEVPTGSVPISPPSSGELIPHDLINLPPPSETPLSPRGKIIDTILSVYRWFVDLMLVVVMCCLATFFYDVEVRVVKSNRRRARENRSRSGRVVIRRNEEFRETSLLRTPPESFSAVIPPWGFV